MAFMQLRKTTTIEARSYVVGAIRRTCELKMVTFLVPEALFPAF